MTAAIPDNEPFELRAGDTWQWTRAGGDYPASAWALTYHFKHPTATGFTVAASADGDDYSISVAATTTAGKTAGRWSWTAQVVAGSEKHTVDAGEVDILPDYTATTTAYDGRSHARTVLDAIEAVIERRATRDQEGYTIAGRSLSRTPLADLLRLRQHYQAEVAAEINAERIRNGLGIGGRIQFRT